MFAALFAASAALAFYHVGVENHFFAGPSACTGPALTGGSIEALTQQLLATPPVQCDQVQWRDPVLQLSLAAWNAIVSLVIVLLLAVAIIDQLRRGGRRTVAAA